MSATVTYPCPDLELLGSEPCTLEAGHDGEHVGASGSRWGDLPDGGYRWVPGDAVEDEVVDVVAPLEERLRTGLVVAGLGTGLLAVVLLVVAFVLAVVARWQPDDARALDGTAVLCVLAAAVVGVLGVVAVRYGIGRPDDVPVVVPPGEAWEASVRRVPPSGESGVSRSADGGR